MGVLGTLVSGSQCNATNANDDQKVDFVPRKMAPLEVLPPGWTSFVDSETKKTVYYKIDEKNTGTYDKPEGAKDYLTGLTKPILGLICEFLDSASIESLAKASMFLKEMVPKDLSTCGSDLRITVDGSTDRLFAGRYELQPEKRNGKPMWAREDDSVDLGQHLFWQPPTDAYPDGRWVFKLDEIYGRGALHSYAGPALRSGPWGPDQSLHVFNVGDRVKAECRKKNKPKWYAAKIHKVNNDGTYDIDWIDGTRTLNHSGQRIRDDDESRHLRFYPITPSPASEQEARR